MLSVIITTFCEPNIRMAINAVLEQKIPDDFELIVAAPDVETENLVTAYKKTYPQIRYFKDPGRGKSFALNVLFKEVRGDILIFTDGDVVLGKNSVKRILKYFSDPAVGVVSGRPVPSNSRNNLFGYWAHLLFEAGAHSIRKKLFSQEKFLEASGYLLAIRANIINEIPLDVAEDAIIPYLFWKRGYKIAYAEDAEVFVKSADNFRDFVKQRVRTAKAHETLTKYAPDFPRVKSLWNEIIFGWHPALSYPKTPRELLWTLALFPARLYIWARVHYEHKIKRKQYNDAWERVESTKK